MVEAKHGLAFEIFECRFVMKNPHSRGQNRIFMCQKSIQNILEKAQ